MKDSDKYYQLLILIPILITGMIVTGCTAKTLGNIAAEAGKTKGAIRDIKVLSEDESGYTLEVSYRDVIFPDGVSVRAEAFDRSRMMPEYVSSHSPISSTRGRTRVNLVYQGSGSTGGTKPRPYRIVAQLYRDDDPHNYFGSKSVDLPQLASQIKVNPDIIKPLPRSGTTPVPTGPIFTPVPVPTPSTGSAGFQAPTYQGKRVDLCLNWGRDCGQPAADRFCTTKGYHHATFWKPAYDIGGSSPTIVMGDGRVCDQPSCDGFQQINCGGMNDKGPVAMSSGIDRNVAFQGPKYQDKRVDLCLNWGRDCGQPAADKWCQLAGFDRALSFTRADDIGGREPTMTIGDNRVCDQPHCDGFAMINCTR